MLPFLRRYCLALLLSVFLLAPGAGLAANLVGLWEFENPSDLGSATIGNNLVLNNANNTINARTGMDGSDGAAEVGLGDSFSLAHGIGPNGGSSAYVNEYAIVYDVYVPASSQGKWRSLLQTADPLDSNDGDYFFKTNNTLGVAAISYSSRTTAAETWYRIIFSADIGESVSFVTTVIDASGSSWQYNHSSQDLDGRHSLYASTNGNIVHFFADENGEDHLVYVTQLGLYDGTIQAPSALALGPPGTPLAQVISPNAPPVIAQAPEHGIRVDMDTQDNTFVLNASDADNDPLTWSIASGPSNGSAGITASSDTAATFFYTPSPGFSGMDSLAIRVSDGKTSQALTVTIRVRDPASPAYPDPVGLWEFDFASDLPIASLGQDLTPWGSSIEGAAGMAQEDGAARIGVGSYFELEHKIPEGNSPGDQVNEYTLLFDVCYESSSPWKTLFQTNSSNSNDGDLFIRPGSGTIGTSAGLGGYSTRGTVADTWYRIIMTVKNGEARRVYVDGSLWFEGSAGGTNDRYGLTRTLLIFADDNSEDGLIKVTNLAVWGQALDLAGIMDLGRAGDFIVDAPTPDPNEHPVITQGESLSLSLGMNSGPHTLTLNVTDTDGDAIAWSVSGNPANGSVDMVSSSDTQAMVSYQPNGLFTGFDTFKIRAADAKVYDEITVNVSVSNTAPVIGQGESFALNAALNGGPRDLVLDATDADGNALEWAIQTQASNGTASMVSQSSAQATIRYAPNTDFSGIDSFVVSVTDGLVSDTILVTVSVTDPNADPKLTIVSPFGTSSPAVGVHTYPSGTQVTVSVAGTISAKARHTPTGWTCIGSGPAQGSGTEVTFEITRDTILTWKFLSEYLIDTQADAGGSVSVSDGWYANTVPLEVTATAQPGHYFSGWSGDTTGALTGGNTLVLPMDREYGTITANFTEEEEFSVIALPDTQNYCNNDSQALIYDAQAQWVVDNVVTENIKFVTHLGDIVNNQYSDDHWRRANGAMDIMNTHLPYGTSPGNHDLSDKYIEHYGPNAQRWINPADGQVYDWYKGSSPTGWSDYQVITVNGRDWMFLHMDIDARDQDIAWAQAVLDAHPATLTVLTTHNYLAETGGGGRSGSGTGARGRVPIQWVSGTDRNNPDEVFQKLVYPNNQIYMVICGHNFAIYNLEETNEAGNVVHEVLVDYQTVPNGGNGFLRIMKFKPSQGVVSHSTYSPSLGRYWDPNNASDSQGMADLHDRYNGSFFDMPVDFDGRFDSRLTVVSSQADVSPAAGTHKIADGKPFVIHAQDRVNNTNREHVTGWTLMGPKQNLSGTGNTATVTMNGDATLTWHYDTEYLLTTRSVGDGIVSVPTGWQEAGAAIAIQAQPDSGASFVRWLGDIEGASIDGPKISFAMDRPRGPVTAQFSGSQTVYTVKVNSVHSNVSPAPATLIYEENDQVTFTASEIVDGQTRHLPTGYTYVPGTGEPVTGLGTSVSLSITTDLEFTWNWKTQHYVDISATGPGAVNPGAGWYDAGAGVVISAAADPHAEFTGWTGNLSGGGENNNQLSIPSLDAPFGPASAGFAMEQYTLTVVSASGNPVPAVGDHVFDYGTRIDLRADSVGLGRTRQVPVAWRTAGALETGGSGNSTSITLTGDTTITWSWETQVLLDVKKGAEGRVRPFDASGWYGLGAVVNLTAQASDKFNFTQWKEGLPGGSDPALPNLSLVMDQPRRITADFSPILAVKGTPHWWMDIQNLAIDGDYDGAESLDRDNNGLTVNQEFIAGLKSGQGFHFRSVERMTGGSPGVAITWDGQRGRDYSILFSSDIDSPFSEISTGISGTGAPHTETIADAGSRGFYKVGVDLLPAGPNDGNRAAESPGLVGLRFAREMVLIPAGSFVMGENDAGIAAVRPEHTVNLDAFYMDRYEVTRGDWKKVAVWANAKGYDLPETLPVYDHLPSDDHPAAPISWFDAAKWCNARSEMEGLEPAYYTDAAGTQVYRTGKISLTNAQVNWSGNGFRLPTEAQWEYAARGGLDGMAYPWGNDAMISRGNSWQNLVSLGQETEPYPITRPVGYFDGSHPVAPGQTARDMANGYGLYDMAGNVFEWVWDWSGAYSGLEEFNPSGPAREPDTPNRILRSGSWWNNSVDSRVFHRQPFPPDGDDPYGVNGFRSVRPAHPAE